MPNFKVRLIFSLKISFVKRFFLYREVTPLETLEIIDLDDCDGSLLASPYLDKGNTKSSDKCLYIGKKETEILWTEECDQSRSLQIWDFKPVKKNSDNFYLINVHSGKCLKPTSHTIGPYVHSVDCTSEKDLIWRWFDGQ